MTATLAPPRPEPYGYKLRLVKPGTPLAWRERQILDLASHGCTNAVIGNRINVTENVVKLCMRAICIRLAAHDRAHAVRRGFELGYLTAEEVTT